MTKVRQATAQEVAINKRKQEELRKAGYTSIKVDGSWGPYQENLYRSLQLKPPGIKKPLLATVAAPLALSAGTVASSPITVPAAILATASLPLLDSDVRDNLRNMWTTGKGLAIGAWNHLTSRDRIEVPVTSPEERAAAERAAAERASEEKPDVTPANPTPDNKPDNKPDDKPEGDNEQKKKFNVSRLLWETEGNSPGSSVYGRVVRNFLLRAPVYHQTVATGIDVADHTLGRFGEAAYGGTRVSNANWNATKYASPFGWGMLLATKPATPQATVKEVRPPEKPQEQTDAFVVVPTAMSDTIPVTYDELGI